MSASAGPLLNGVLPVPPQSVDPGLEYQKILRIRDEVFSGNHPRLTVPAHAIRVPSSQTPSTVSQSQLNVSSPLPATVAPNRRGSASAAQSTKREDDMPQPPNQPNGVSVPPTTQPASNVSEFDPVLLTKSDDLVRAETVLKRQRLEKSLKDQFERKRADARKKPAPSEAKPDFDLPAMFAKVTGTAKPSSAKDDEENTDSVNEEEFYSSRAPDSTPDGPPASNSPDAADKEQPDEPSGPRVVSAVMGAPLDADAKPDLPAAIPATAPAPPPPPAAAAPPAPNPSQPTDPAPMDIDDEEEEGEYSPPEAMAQVPSPKVTHPQDIPDSRDPRGRPLRRYSELDDPGGRPPSPPEAHMRIVRNHITSPFAPRPSRVSPLAVAKDSLLSQNTRSGPRKQWIGRPGSPPSPDDNQAIPPRKRRKTDGRNQRRARKNGRNSPDVKEEEDVSPPPFHQVQPLGSARFRSSGPDRPIVIDDEPLQDGRYQPPPNQRYVDSPSRPIPRQLDRLMPTSEPRPLSRASVRPGRDDQDLRRVASMHNMRAEPPPRDYVDPYYNTPTRTRAVSYARMGSPALTESGRHHEPVEYDQPPDMRVAHTPAPMYREIYDERDGTYHRYIAEPMPPPPPPVERIIVDSYGRRFREIVHDRPPMEGREMSVRRNEVDPMYEPYPRQARASSVWADAPPDRGYPSEMPPPPVSYRRVAEPPRSSAVRSPATREYLEPAPPSRSASVAMLDRPPRQAMYPDERHEFREPVRVGSVRPPASRYDDGPPPMEMHPRAPSVRPGGREGSVFMDDRRPLGPDYGHGPAAEPRYRDMEPDRRYMDDGREIAPADGMMDGRQRGMERY